MITETFRSASVEWDGNKSDSDSAACGHFSISPAVAGDHASVWHFLTAVFQTPSHADFRAALNEPFYEPRDRLLLRSGDELVGHVHLTHRAIHLGSVEVPMAGLEGLGVLPGYRGRGFARRLLAAAHTRMEADGVLIGLLWTRVPHFFRERGWIACLQRQTWQVGVHRLLSEMCARGLYPRKNKRLRVRPLRLLEIPGLERIYRNNSAGRFGPLVRTERYCEWLVERRGYDQMLVALDGPEVLELDQRAKRVVACMATRGDRVVELIARPGDTEAPFELLTRACGDVIERGGHALQLDAPPDHPIRELFCQAGATPTRADRAEVCMARLVNPLQLLRALSGELRRRAATAGISLPFDLAFVVDDRCCHLEVSHGDVVVSATPSGGPTIFLDAADFTRMLLGRLDWDSALGQGRVRPSTAAAPETARALFPLASWWQSPLDELPAREVS